MDEPEIKTIILRFRDLVTGVGETIANHAEIRQRNSAVWWGWWAKGGERVPYAAFAALLAMARAAPFQLLLFDSGGSRLYQARCNDIRYDPAGERIPTPDLAEVYKLDALTGGTRREYQTAFVF